MGTLKSPDDPRDFIYDENFVTDCATQTIASMSQLFNFYDQLIKQRLVEFRTKRDRYRKMYFVLKSSAVVLQSSGILSIGTTFFTNDLIAKVVAFAATSVCLICEGLDKMLKAEQRFRFYTKRVKDFERLEALLLERQLRRESIGDIKAMITQYDDDASA